MASWSNQADGIRPGEIVAWDDWGASVAIVGDVMVGSAPDHDAKDGGFVGGKLYHYARSGDAWALVEGFWNSTNTFADGLGTALAMDGDWLVAGSPGFDTGFPNVGAVYSWQRVGGVWVEDDSINGSDSNSGFGSALALDENSEGDLTVVIGAYNYIPATRNGKVFVYIYSSGTWSIQDTIDTVDGTNCEFGTAVAMSGDTIVVGAPRTSSYSGAVHVFLRSGSNWNLQQSIPSHAFGQSFGTAVAIFGDVMVIGAPNGDTNDQGIAYIYTRSSGVWTLTKTLTPTGRDVNSNFGKAVAIGSASRLMVGCDAGDGSGISGAFYYELVDGTWTEMQTLVPTTGAGYYIGQRALAMDETNAVLGAPSAPSSGAGRASIFNAPTPADDTQSPSRGMAPSGVNSLMLQPVGSSGTAEITSPVSMDLYFSPDDDKLLGGTD